MMITESKLTDVMGYTRNEIKGRRALHWLEGLHYAFDPAGKILYNVEEIQKWAHPALGINAANARYDGVKAPSNAVEFCQLHGVTPGAKRRRKYV